MKAVIIGGGLGGLAVALRLRARGWEVTVCEAGETFGGKMNSWTEQGYRFDTGPSLLTLPHVFAELYESIGTRMDEHLSLIRVDPHAEYRFADRTTLVVPADKDSWRATIRAIEPKDAAAFPSFLALGRKLYELSCRTFFRRSPLSPPSISELGALRFLPGWRGWGNYAKTVASFFRSPYLQQLYNRYPTYVGSSPYSSPATLLVIPYLEHQFGAWYVKGGLYRVITSLVELACARGVDLRLSTRVVAIERSGNRVSGVRLQNGSRISADTVVMNGDAANVSGLLGRPSAPNQEARSLSGVVLLLGLRSRPPGLPHHTVLFSRDYCAEFDDLFRRRTFPADPTLYISSPGLTDPSVAPPGGEAMFVMANAPAGDESIWTDTRAQQVREQVLSRLAAAGFSVDAEFESMWHPGRFAQRYLAPGGAIYGTNSHGWKRAFFRPSNRSHDVSGLYLVGGSSHPGGGTPTVLMSAKITAEMICSDASS